MDGRKALITGGSAGLGKAMARAFAASGAEVAIVARRPEVLESAKAEIEAATGGRVLAYSCDVADAGAVAETFAKAHAELGRIDILVNNAGTSRTGAFLDITDDMWHDDLELKLFGAIRFARLAFPGMTARKWGRIINVLNIGAKAPGAGSAPTSVSRAAGMALTKVLSQEGAAHNVLVNALLVGFIESDQWAGWYEKVANQTTYDEYLDSMAKELAVPLGRFGTAEEFANIACFLASEAGSYITGTAINVDGGRSPVV